MKTVAMDAIAFVLIFHLISISCEANEGPDENGQALSATDLLGLEPNVFHDIEKRQDIGYTQYTASEADAIVERHNYFRSTTNPSASNMKHMVRFFFFFDRIPQVVGTRFQMMHIMQRSGNS